MNLSVIYPKQTAPLPPAQANCVLSGVHAISKIEPLLG